MTVPIKLMLMSAVEIKAEINRYLERVEDERFLKIVHSMLDTYLKEHSEEEDAIEGYDLQGNPQRARELMDKYEAGLEAVKRGEYITVEELAEKSKEWLSRTK